ncbi:MAG: fumarate reductase/succinate dehydrogenase flavoprotein subunit [bacterium]
MELNANIPTGELKNKWANRKLEMGLVSPSNRRRFKIIIVGSGLAGASAAAGLGELGYNVEVFTYNDSPRRAHSIAAQGGINAAKNYKNDGDSIERLFLDTIKGGDYRSREANVYRLAELSNNIIDHCTAQGVPFARDYSGLLDNRSFGGAQLSRTFYAKGQTGQQLLLGAYSALSRQIKAGTVKLHTRLEILDIVVTPEGRAVGIITRDNLTGELERFTADAVVLATGGYSNVFYLSTNAKACNATAIIQAYKHGAGFANPCYTQIHPTCIPPSGDYQSKLTLMSESLRNDGRIWVSKKQNDKRKPSEIPENERDYFLERKYPSYGNLVPRDIASRAIKEVCDQGFGVAGSGLGVYLDFSEAINRLGKKTIGERYGNLFEMYETITGANPYDTPMMIYPASHYTMGGLWVDYNLMTTVNGLFAIGEANFSDHGANRLGASALMQGLADGYFVLPATMANFLAKEGNANITIGATEFHESLKSTKSRIDLLLKSKGTKTPQYFHRALGKIVWDKCGMNRNEADLKIAQKEIADLQNEFESDLLISKDPAINASLETALRVADFFEVAKLMVIDALNRRESCGSHFCTEFQTEDGEAQRNDDEFLHCTVWEYMGEGKIPILHKENLNFEYVQLKQRNYK